MSKHSDDDNVIRFEIPAGPVEEDYEDQDLLLCPYCDSFMWTLDFDLHPTCGYCGEPLEMEWDE